MKLFDNLTSESMVREAVGDDRFYDLWRELDRFRQDPARARVNFTRVYRMTMGDNLTAELWALIRQQARLMADDQIERKFLVELEQLTSQNNWTEEQQTTLLRTFPRIRIEVDKDKVVPVFSYFPNNLALLRDRRIATKPGRAAMALGLGETCAKQLSEMLEDQMKAPELKWARTREEIRTVYSAGANSCMANKTWHQTGGVAPVEVYATDDIGVAYIGDINHVKARCVCNMNEKTFSRAYGNSLLIRSALEAAGFHHNQYALIGCRILNIPVPGFEEYRAVVPFLDWGSGDWGRKDGLGNTSPTAWGNLGIELHDEQFHIVSRYGCTGNYETGYARIKAEPQPEPEEDDEEDDTSWYCAHCDEGCTDDDTSYTAFLHEDTASICETCADADFIEAHICTRWGTTLVAYVRHTDTINCVSDSEHYSNDERTREHYNLVQANDGEWYLGDDVTWDDIDDTYYPNTECSLCDATDEWFHNDNLTELRDGRIVSDRWRDENCEVITAGPDTGEWEETENLVELHDDTWALIEHCTECEDPNTGENYYALTERVVQSATSGRFCRLEQCVEYDGVQLHPDDLDQARAGLYHPGQERLGQAQTHQAHC